MGDSHLPAGVFLGQNPKAVPVGISDRLDVEALCAKHEDESTCRGNRTRNRRFFPRVKQYEWGDNTADICRKLGVGRATFYMWKKQYTGLGVQELRELQSLREENGHLKRIVADLTLDRQILQEIVSKKL